MATKQVGTAADSPTETVTLAQLLAAVKPYEVIGNADEVPLGLAADTLLIRKAI